VTAQLRQIEGSLLLLKGPLFHRTRGCRNFRGRRRSLGVATNTRAVSTVAEPKKTRTLTEKGSRA
jgi:hypothetical protein